MRVAVIIVALVAATVPSARPIAHARLPQTQTPVFRSGAVLVPIDVRVLDRNGRSISDLKATDFAIIEDGIAQEISIFSPQAIMPEAPDARSAARPVSFGPQMSGQSRRIFLFVLGRGRLQEPSMGVDAVQRFVRELLLPQDQVAILAWDRATDFTTDRSHLTQVLERFRRKHEAIEQMLRDRFSGLAAVYGGKLLPRDIQQAIDGVFAGPENASTREVPAAPIANANRIDADNRRTADLLMGSRTGGLGAVEAEPMSAAFDQFVAESRQTMQDVGNLYTGIEYLRRLEGEKHLVFVTERGIILPRLEDDLSLASRASDARVAIDTIQTGGVSPALPPPPPPTASNSNQPMSQTMRDSLAAATLRTISSLTGGQVSVFEPAQPAIENINSATRFGYLIGYSPSNTDWNGKYRRITIKVTRPDVSVLYRHGYYGQPSLTAFDHRELVTSSRMNAAAGYREEIRDIKVEGKASSIKVGDTTAQIFVEMTIDASRLKFEEFPGERRGHLSVAIACFGPTQRNVGQSAFNVDLPFDDLEFRARLKDGIPYSLTIPVTGAAATVKIVVYDFAADLVGTRFLRVK